MEQINQQNMTREHIKAEAWNAEIRKGEQGNHEWVWYIKHWPCRNVWSKLVSLLFRKGICCGARGEGAGELEAAAQAEWSAVHCHRWHIHRQTKKNTTRYADHKEHIIGKGESSRSKAEHSETLLAMKTSLRCDLIRLQGEEALTENWNWVVDTATLLQSEA